MQAGEPHRNPGGKTFQGGWWTKPENLNLAAVDLLRPLDLQSSKKILCVGNLTGHSAGEKFFGLRKAD